MIQPFQKLVAAVYPKMSDDPTSRIDESVEVATIIGLGSLA